MAVIRIIVIVVIVVIIQIKITNQKRTMLYEKKKTREFPQL